MHVCSLFINFVVIFNIMWVFEPIDLPLIEEMIPRLVLCNSDSKFAPKMSSDDFEQIRSFLTSHALASHRYQSLWKCIREVITENSISTGINQDSPILNFEKSTMKAKAHILFTSLFKAVTRQWTESTALDILNDRSYLNTTETILPMLAIVCDELDCKNYINVVLQSTLAKEHLLALFKQLPQQSIAVIIDEIIHIDMQQYSSSSSSSNASQHYRYLRLLDQLGTENIKYALAIRSLLTQKKHLPALCMKMTLYHIKDIAKYLTILINDLTSMTNHWFFSSKFEIQVQYFRDAIDILSQQAMSLLEGINTTNSNENLENITSNSFNELKIILRCLCVLSFWGSTQNTISFLTCILDRFSMIGSTMKIDIHHILLNEYRNIYRIIICFILTILSHLESKNAVNVQTLINRALLLQFSEDQQLHFDSYFQFSVIVACNSNNISILEDIYSKVIEISPLFCKSFLQKGLHFTKETFANLNVGICIRKFFELVVPAEISAASESAADWMSCLDVFLSAIQCRSIQYRCPIHDLCVQVIKCSRFPPHSRTMKVLSTWLDCCSSMMSTVGLPLLPNETHDIIQGIFVKFRGNIVKSTDLESIPEVSRSHLNRIELLTDEQIIVKHLLKYKSNTKSGTENNMVDSLEMIGQESEMWKLCLTTWCAMLWKYSYWNLEKISRMNLRSDILFDVDILNLPVKTCICFLLHYNHQNDRPTITYILQSTLTMLRQLCPCLLLSQQISWIHNSPILNSLPILEYEDLLQNLLKTVTFPAWLYHKIKHMSMEQLDTLSDHLLSIFINFDENKRYNDVTLWKTWYQIYLSHPFHFLLLVKTYRRLISLLFPNLLSATIINYSFQAFVDEPILIFRSPELLFKYLFSFNILSLILRNAMLNSKAKVTNDIAVKLKIKTYFPDFHTNFDNIQEITPNKYLSIQDCMVIRLLAEVYSKCVRTETKTALHVKDMAELAEWILVYREHSSLILRLLIQQGITEFTMELFKHSALSMQLFGTSFLAILTSGEPPGLLSDSISVIKGVSHYLTRWNAKLVTLDILGILSPYIIRIYSLLSVYHCIEELDKVVLELLLIGTKIAPHFLPKFIVLATKRLEHSIIIIDSILQKAEMMYAKLKREALQIGRRSQSVADEEPHIMVAPL